MRKVDHTGRRFGRLKVIKLIVRRGKSRNDTIYLCRCDCGREKQVRYSNLMNGGTLSCGCLQKELLSKRAKDPLEVAITAKFNSYKGGAKVRNYGWHISKEYFAELIRKSCYFCAASPNPLNGVDRFDNRWSYTIENCVPCCSICNMAKATLTVEQFKDWVKHVYVNLFLVEH
jgi:hypothetical protein